MPTLVWKGTKAELLAKLHALGGALAGTAPAPQAAVESLLTAMGTVLLGKIKENYLVQSEGGSGELGTGPWPDLSPVTLALRTKDSSLKKVAALSQKLDGLPAHRRRQIQRQYDRLTELYRADTRSLPGARRARKYARRLLEELKPHISATRYKKLSGELREQTPERAFRLGFSGAYALILRDTGRLLNSLSPGHHVGQVLEVRPGCITVGSNVTTPTGENLLDKHDHGGPRDLKRDGTPILPRRQVLPDDEHPIPPQWWDAMLGVLARGLATREFWVAYLGGKAA